MSERDDLVLTLARAWESYPPDGPGFEDLLELATRRVNAVRAEAFREAADVAGSEGNHWSGQPSLALFELSIKLCRMAEENQ